MLIDIQIFESDPQVSTDESFSQLFIGLGLCVSSELFLHHIVDILCLSQVFAAI